MDRLTRKQRETEILKERVLDTAEDIFAREGVDQVTMRRIADGIEYAPTVLYRLFANKADLLDHLIARGYTGVRLDYENVLGRDDQEPRELLEGILTVYVQYALSHPNHYRMWFDTGHLSQKGQQLYMSHGKLKFIVFQAWLDRIEACKEDGMYSGQDTLEVFQCLWSRVHGLISLRLQHPNMSWMPLSKHISSVLEPASA